MRGLVLLFPIFCFNLPSYLFYYNLLGFVLYFNYYENVKIYIIF